MKVSELSRRAGIAASAVRYYESIGLLPQPTRSESGYRTYDEADLCRVRVLTALRSLGLELPEAARLADLCSSGRCDVMADDLLPQLATRREQVQSAREELDHLDARLALLETAIHGGKTELGLEGVCCATDDQDCACPA